MEPGGILDVSGIAGGAVSTPGLEDFPIVIKCDFVNIFAVARNRTEIPQHIGGVQLNMRRIPRCPTALKREKKIKTSFGTGHNDIDHFLISHFHPV